MRYPLFLAVLLVSSAYAGDWPQWRGPERNGISKEDVIAKFPGGQPTVLWKAAVGTGFSSFAVSHGKAYTLGHSGSEDTVFCLEMKTGKVLWKHSYPAELGDKYFEGGPLSSPSVSEGHVFALSKWGELFCFEAATGKVVWSKNVATETKATIPDWGFAGSPLVQGNLLVLNMGEGGTTLDKATGAVKWTSANDESAGYCTPLPYVKDGQSLATMANTRGYYAVDIATGKQQWFFKWVTRYGINAADPIPVAGQFLISSGYGKGAALVKADSAEPVVVWQNRLLRTQMNPAVLVGDYVYGVDGDEGSEPELRCLEVATGKVTWKTPSIKGGGLIVAKDKLVLLSGDGTLSIAKAKPDAYAALTSARVIQGKCWTAPVLSNGILLCRSALGEVVAIDVAVK